MLLQIIGEKKSKFIQILTSCNGFIKINMHLIPNQVIKKKKNKKNPKQNTVSIDLFKALVTHLGKKEGEKNPKNKQTKKQVTSQILES